MPELCDRRDRPRGSVGMKKHERIKRLEEEVEKLSSMILAEVNASEDLEGRMGGEIMKAKKYAKDEARKYKEDLATSIFPRLNEAEARIKAINMRFDQYERREFLKSISMQERIRKLEK